MDKLKLKTKLSKVIDDASVTLAMLVMHDKKQRKDKKTLASKIIRAYNIRSKTKGV